MFLDTRLDRQRLALVPAVATVDQNVALLVPQDVDVHRAVVAVDDDHTLDGHSERAAVTHTPNVAADLRILGRLFGEAGLGGLAPLDGALNDGHLARGEATEVIQLATEPFEQLGELATAERALVQEANDLGIGFGELDQLLRLGLAGIGQNPAANSSFIRSFVLDHASHRSLHRLTHIQIVAPSGRASTLRFDEFRKEDDEKDEGCGEHPERIEPPQGFLQLDPGCGMTDFIQEIHGSLLRFPIRIVIFFECLSVKLTDEENDSHRGAERIVSVNQMIVRAGFAVRDIGGDPQLGVIGIGVVEQFHRVIS